MKHRHRFIALITTLVIVSVSCQHASFLTLRDPNKLTFEKNGGSQSLVFSTNKD